MIVLGFDTATPSTTVALMLPDGSSLHARDDPTPEQRPTHSTHLLPLANLLLAQAQLEWGDIDRIAVGVGPGTFTGLRIGIATARGLAQSLEAELVGVSTLRALAHATHERIHDETGGPASYETLHTDTVLTVIDARRGETFAAAYHGPNELTEPQVCPPHSLLDLIAPAAATDRKRKWIAIGDGALRYRDALEHPDVTLPAPDSPLHKVDARAICKLGERVDPRDPNVLPDYLRRPDAELALVGTGAPAR